MHLTNSRWKFSVSVLLPVVAAVLLTLGLAAGFVVWSAGRADEGALRRQQALAAQMVLSAKSDFEVSQTDQVLRYDIVDVFAGKRPDLGSIDDYFGSDEYDTYEHEQVFVLDPNLKPIYAAKSGDKADVAAYEAERSLIEPLAASLRAPDKQAAIQSYQDGDTDYPPQASDFATIDGRIAVIAVVPIVSNWNDQAQKLSHLYYHVAVEFADADTAKYLGDQYLVDGVHFDVAAATAPGQAAVPISNNAGRFVGWLKWTPQRPGHELLAETLPASLGLLGVVVLVISLLLFGLARSTKALEKARAEALHRATHDPLTGLANRALFNEKLERSPLPLTLLALDLDRFKAVNDTFGHEAGDEVLRQVATRLQTLVRESDLVARIGGDEFMILLVGRIEDGRAQQLAAQIVGALAVPFQLGMDTASIGVSVGIATAFTDERKELVSRADFALYDAKESGRNTFKVFDDLHKAA